MHPTESGTPSEDVHEPQAAEAPAETSPEATEDQASPSWWQRLTSRFTGREESEPSTEESPAEAAQTAQRTLTDDELQRLIQSEVDKREAARNKAARDAERKRLRDEDPWQYVEQERMQEQAQLQDSQLTETLQAIGQIHDAVTILPMLEQLDPKEKERLMSLPGAGVGVDGRKLLTAEALKSLEKHWRAQGAKDAEARLRRNGSFRKQVLAEFGGDRAEPEQVPNGSYARARTSSQDVNDMLRRQLGMNTTE